MKIFFRVLILLAFIFPSIARGDDDLSSSYDTAVNDVSVSSLGIQEVGTSSLSSVEKKIRNAAVKVFSGGGHGSGTYIKIRGFHLVLTAAHVTEGSLGDAYEIQGDPNTSVVGVLVYEDREIDVAAILVPEIPNKKPMKYRPLKLPSEVGTKIVYSGYPSDLSLLTIRGSVAGHETVMPRGTVVLLHTYGWFGCSGSGIYDENGRYVGVLWGVSVERTPFGIPQIIEDIIWVTPSNLIDENEILSGIIRLSGVSSMHSRRNLRKAARKIKR